MRNSPQLPLLALVLAEALAITTVIVYWSQPLRTPFSLNEIEIALVAWALVLAIYGLQGIISVITEGQELHLGQSAPRLTNPLSAAIVVFALLLFPDAIALGIGIASSWRVEFIGVLAGVGCLDLAILLIFYKEAFVGDEACLDEIDDGIPW